MGLQVYRGANGGRARSVEGALTATTPNLHIHLLVALPLLIPPQSVCRYTHRHTDAEWKSVDYSDWLRKTMWSRTRWSCEKNTFLLVQSGEAGTMSAAPWKPNKDRASKERFPVTHTPVKGTTDSVLLCVLILLYL